MLYSVCFSYLCNQFIHPLYLTSLNILVTSYVALLALGNMASIFLSHVFQKWLHIRHPRTDFLYLGRRFNFCFSSSETYFCLRVLQTSLQLISDQSYMDFAERDGILSALFFLSSSPNSQAFPRKGRIKAVCSSSHFRKLTFV